MEAALAQEIRNLTSLLAELFTAEWICKTNNNSNSTQTNKDPPTRGVMFPT